jgi:hypothetical protein
MVFLTIEPKWDSFRGQPAFQSLLRRCGLPELEATTSSRFLAEKGLG